MIAWMCPSDVLTRALTFRDYIMICGDLCDQAVGCIDIEKFGDGSNEFLLAVDDVFVSQNGSAHGVELNHPGFGRGLVY